MRYSCASSPRPGSSRLVDVLFVIVLLSALLAGCSGPADADAPGTLDGSDDPAAAAVQITGVVVGFVGMGMVVENHSSLTLKSVAIVVNEGGAEGGYRFRIQELGPNTTNTYLTQVFRNPEGESLDPDAVKVQKFALYADTPEGRGVWRGAY
ncbi:MAG: hypothetical protein O3A53_08640 [Acidobacteria bacterium]|nr:hypothetical protein [Acidobacteriota bacterium]MDA1234854.1 hypothetical protein [Acidobacteriota bacterium]